jgi:hypothetical protein
MHFRMKPFLAAPESFLPCALTAFGKQASRLHFLTKLLSAAPASGLPCLPTALLAHVACAIAGPIAKAVIMAAKRIGFMAPSQSNGQCKQHDSADPDNQHRKRYCIIIEPVSALYAHDATSILK